MPKSFSSIPAAIAAIARGQVVIVLDDEDRENEGDFVCAAPRQPGPVAALPELHLDCWQ